MDEPEKSNEAAQTISTWDAPMAGTMLVPPGVATRVLIPIPRTALTGLQNGLVLSLHPPPNYNDPTRTPPRKSTSALFFRNPDDATYGRPGLRLDYGLNKITGKLDYHWNIEGRGKARVRFQNLTDHMTVGKTGEVVFEAAKAFRIAGRVLVVSGAVVDGVSILLSTHPLQRGIEVITAWSLAGAGAVRLGSFGAEIGTSVEPGLGTAIGGGIGAVLGSIGGYYAGETGVRYLYTWPRSTIFKPFPQTPVPK